jgi:primase-polymerase (primpol)-like protein
MAEKCEKCSERMPILSRADARYCSTKCRVAAHRERQKLPKELRNRPRWVRYSSKKVPLTTAGKAASSIDPETWSTYEAANRSKVGAGTGFVLNGDGLVCIDIDHCLTDGRLSDRAASVLAALPPTYVEISPSGDGIHVWGYGTLPHGMKRNGIEIYGSGRYITVTGNRWRDCAETLANLGELTRLL